MKKKQHSPKLSGGVWVLLAGLAWLAPGCSKPPAHDAITSDANGYVCGSCREKFYTARKVYAEQCPKCKSIEIREVAAFICGSDQKVTITARNESALCSQCNSPVQTLKLPKARELEAWGAKSRSQARSCGGVSQAGRLASY